MEKHLLKLLIYNFVIIPIFLTQTVLGQQGTGNTILYQERADFQVRGDMQVIGNTNLGVRGDFDGVSGRMPNDEYNGRRNNGTSSPPTRAYIDIDSDRSDPRFAPLFSAGLSNFETEYTGAVDANGRQVPSGPGDDGSTYTGTFNSSASRLDINTLNSSCITVVQAYLYWGGIYATDGVSGVTSATRNPFCNDITSRECADYTEIKILPPNGTQYYDISKHNLDGSSRTSNPGGLVIQAQVIFDGELDSYFNNNITFDLDTNPSTDPAIGPQPRNSALTDNSRGGVPLLPGDRTQDAPYACRADVTELFQTLQANGDDILGWWTVANIPSTVSSRTRGLGSGWTLAVIYEDESATNERRIFFFDGFSYISNDDDDPVEFTIGPFSTDPNAIPINATIAAAGLEGDRTFTRDQFLINTVTIDGLVPPATLPDSERPRVLDPDDRVIQLEESPLSNHHGVPDENTRINFFNSTITNATITGGFRQPNSSNTLGFDTDLFNLVNTNNRVLNNGNDFGDGRLNIVTDTEATFILATEGESFGNHFVGFAVDIIGPDVRILKEAFRSTDLTTSLPQNSAVNFDEEVVYRLTVNNVGNDDATELALTEFIPANTQLLNRITGEELSLTTPDSELGDFFEFIGLPPGFPAPIITRTREDAPNSITNFPFETDRIDFTNLPRLSRGDCATEGSTCESATQTQEFIIEFRIRVLGECSPERNSCYDQLVNFVGGEFNGDLFRRLPGNLFSARSAFDTNVDCNSLIEGPTVQLPSRVAQCDSEVGTICEAGGNADIAGSVGFEVYNLYFYPLADIADGSGNIIDVNGNGRIDDADYPIDPSRLIRTQVLAGSITANDPALLAALGSPIVSATPNVFTVNATGFYLIESINDETGISDLRCADGLETFNVGVFDVSLPNNRPLEDPDLLADARGVILPLCSINNQSIVQYEICNGSITIPTNYPDGTIVEWRQVDSGTCTTTTNPINCPITGPAGCDFQLIRTNQDPSSGPLAFGDAGNTLTVTEPGDYSLRATLANGGCTVTFFFRVVEFVNSNITVSVPSTTTCNTLPEAIVNGLPTTAGSLQYDLRYEITDTSGGNVVVTQSPTDADYGSTPIPRPTVLPGTATVRVIATPILTSTAIDATNCTIEATESIIFTQSEIVDFSVSRSPSCIVDQTSSPGFDDSRADLTVEVTAGSEQYFYQLINTQGTATVADDILVAFESTNLNTTSFADVDTGVEFKLRVFLNGEGPDLSDPQQQVTSTVADLASGPSAIVLGCILEELLAPIPEPMDFTATIQTIREVTCEPGIIEVNIFEGTSTTPSPAPARFSIPAFNVFDQNSGFQIMIQDESLRPPAVPEDSIGAGISADPTTNIFYIDFTTITSFDLQVNLNDTCLRIINGLSNPLSPYEGLSLILDPSVSPNPVGASCNGNNDGQFTVAARNATGGTLTAGLNLEYEIISSTSTAVVVPVTQPDPFFNNLPEGTYQVIVRDITDPVNPCESAPIDVIITEPNPLIAPTIAIVDNFDCTQNGSITIAIPDGLGGVFNNNELLPGGSIDLGGTKPYTFLLFETTSGTSSGDEIATTAPLTDAASLATLPFTGLVAGIYQVRIRDVNGAVVGCVLSPLSNQVEFFGLSQITGFTETIDLFNCATGTNTLNETTRVQVTATPDGGGTITNYEIITLNPTVSPPITPIVTNSTTGEFNLPVGTYEIEATTSTACTDTVTVEVLPALSISIASLPTPANIICSADVVGTPEIENTSSTSAVITGISATGFTHELLLGTTRIDANSSLLDGLGNPIAATTTTIDLTDLVVGTYTFTVTDAETGCVDTQNFTVGDAPAPPVVTIDDAPEYICTGANTGSYTFSVQGSGGTGTDYVFSIDTPTTIPVNADGTSFTVPVPATGSVTYEVAVRDTNCPGPNVLLVTVDAIENFTAVFNEGASNLCVPTSPADPNLSIAIDVTGQPNFRYQQVLNGANVGGVIDVTTVATTSGQIIIDLPTPVTTVTNNYEFIIFDANHDDLACTITVPVTINPLLDVSTPVEVNPNCDSAGALPTNGANVTFSVSGGTGTFVYTLTRVSDGANITPPFAGVTQTGSNSTPTFDFSNAFDNEAIEIQITDNATNPCVAASPVTFTPNFPEPPVVDNLNFVPSKCFGDPSSLTIELDFSDGSNITDYEFSFNGGTTFSASNVFPNPPAGVVNYEVRRLATNCLLSDAITLQQPTQIVEVSQNLTNPSCDLSGMLLPGAIEFTVSGGFIINPTTPPIAPPLPTPAIQADATYDFNLRLLGDPTILQSLTGVTSTAIGSTVNFANLQPGTYTIEAILNDSDADATNNCSNIFTITLPPEPFVNVVDVQFNTTTCSAGVELYVVIDGGANPANFEMFIDRVDMIFLNPSAQPTDYIARLRDPDFLEATPLPPGITIPTIPDFTTLPSFATDSDPDDDEQIRERFFRFTGLPPGGQYRIVVRDGTTGCQTEAVIDAPDAESIDVTNVVTTNTGDCGIPATGTATVTFDIIASPVDPLFGDYVIQLQRPGLPDNPAESRTITVIDPSGPPPSGPDEFTGTFVPGVPTAMPPIPERLNDIVVTLENLPEILITENAFIKVSQVGSDCSDVSAPITIDTNPPLDNFEVVDTQAANCNTDATIVVSVTGGNPPYSYIVVENGTTPAPDAASVFPLTSSTITLPVTDTRITPAAPTVALPNLFGTVEIYVRDQNLCVLGPITGNVLFDVPPTLAIDALVDECTDGPYTVNYTISNFDTNQTYEFLINGTTTVAVNNASLTPVSTGVVSGSLTVNSGRRTYDFELSGNGGCSSTDSFTVFPALNVTATPSAANCDDEFNEVEINVTGGFDGEITRELTYELILQSSSAVLATQVTSSSNVTFTNGAGGLTLATATQYEVRVTDRLDPSATPVRVCDITVEVPQVPTIVLPTFDLTIDEASCPGTADGEIEFNILTAGDTPPSTFRLYQFADLASANAAATAANGSGDFSLVTAATLVNNPLNNSEYVGLAPDPVAYVAFIEATGLSCPTPVIVAQVPNPAVPLVSDFNISQTNGDCTDFDRTNDATTLNVEVLTLTPPSATLAYSITGPSFNQPQTPITITGGLPFTVPGIPELPASRTSDLIYTLEIVNTNQPTCNPLTFTITVPQCEGIDPPLEPLVVDLVLDPLVCDDDTSGTGTVTVSGKAVLDYSFTVTGGISTPQSGIINLGTVTAPDTPGSFRLTNLDPSQTYTVSVLDRTDARADLVFSDPETFTIPAALSITPGAEVITCVANAPSTRITYTVNEGTAPYTFTLTNNTTATTGAPVIPPSNGNAQFFDFTTDGSYTLNVTDVNSCDTEITFNIDVPEAIAGTLAVNNECLPNASSTDPIEVQIDITSGTAPFRFRSYLDGATPGAFSADITGTRIVDNSITTAGDYVFEIIDANSCPLVFPTFTIAPPLEVPVSGITRVEPVCNVTPPITDPQARTNGQITYAPTGGLPPYTFEVAELTTSGQDPTALFAPFTTGFPFEVTEAQASSFFVFRVTDANGCQLILPEFNFVFPETPVASVAINNIECRGGTGSITVQAPTAGVGPFTYAFFEGTTRPSPDPVGFFTNVNVVTSTEERTFTYIVRDANGCESAPMQATIIDNSIQEASLTSTPVTCEIIPPATTSTNDNGTITLTILRGAPNFTYTIFDDAGVQVATATDNIDATVDGTATTPNRTITFGMLTIGNYEIQVTDATPGCAPVSFFRTVSSASPVTTSPPLFSDCQTLEGGVTALFSISGATAPLIESPTAGVLVDPTVGGDDVIPYNDIIAEVASITNQADLDALFGGFRPTVGTEGNFYAIRGLASNTLFSLEIQDSVTLCNTVINLQADIDLVNITDVTVMADSFCPPLGTPVEGALSVTFEVGTSGATLFDVTLLDDDDNVITLAAALPNPRMNVPVGTETFSGLPAGRYKVRVDEPGGVCGDESEIFEIIQAPPLNMATIVGQTNASCASNVAPQFATVTVAASGGILFDPTSATDTNGYLFAIVPAGSPAPTFISETDPTDDFFDQVTFVFDPAGTPALDIGVSGLNWEVYVRDNSGCPLLPPLAVTIGVDPEPVLASLANTLSLNQCDGPNFPIDVEVTNFDASRAPYVFDILEGATVVVANALTIDATAASGTGSVTIPARGTFEVRVTDVNGCNVSESIIINEELAVTALTGTANCDNTINGVQADVTGGFVTGTRDLTYELFEVGVTTPVNTITNVGITAATDSANFTTDSAANPLQSGVNYFVRVTDNFGAATPPNCEAVSNTVNIPSIVRSIPNTIEVISEETCFGAADASIRLTVQTPPAGSTPTTPIAFELYQFDTVINANAFIASNPTATPTAAITGFVADFTANARPGEINVFDNLPPGIYVGAVINDFCFTVFPTSIEVIPEPAYVLPLIAATGEPGTCNPTIISSFIRISISSDALGNINGIPPFSYRISPTGTPSTAPFVVIDETLPSALPATFPPSSVVITVDIPSTGGNFDVEFRDASNILCPIPAIPTSSIVVPEFNLPTISVAQDAAAANGGAYSCISNERVRVAVTGLPGERFTIEAIPLAGSTPTISTNPQTGLIVPAFGAAEAEAFFEFTGAGMYEFRAVNEVSTCDVTSDEYEIEELEQLSIRIVGTPQVTCFGDEDQQIRFVIENIDGFVSYEIFDSGGVLVFPLLAEGDVVPTIVPVSASLEIASPARFGAGDYQIVATASDSGGTSVRPNPNALCNSTATATIRDVLEPVLTINPIDPITCVDPFITITTNVTNGVPPFEYRLTGSTSGVITRFSTDPGIQPINTSGFFGAALNLGAQVYTIEVRDSNGCEFTAPAVTPEQLISVPIINTTVATSPLCNDDNTGTIVVEAAFTNIAATVPGELTFTLFQDLGTSGIVEVTDTTVTAPAVGGATLNHTFTAIAGAPGAPATFFVEVADQFGCVSARTGALTLERPTPVVFETPEVVQSISCVNTQQTRINVSGGTGAITVELLQRDPSGERSDPIVVVATNNSPSLGAREFDIVPGNNFFRATDANGCEAFFQMTGDEPPVPIDYEITPRQEDRVTLCFGETSFVDVDGSVTGGLSGFGYSLHVAVPSAAVGGFTELETVIDELGNNVNSNLILQAARRNGVTRFEQLRSLETLIASGTYPADAVYVYRVTSGDCDPVYRPFEIFERAEIIVEPLDIILPVCAGEANAEVNITIANSSDPGEYSITIIREVGGVFDIGISASARLLNIDSAPGANRTVNFSNLEAGNYQLLVTGNDCPLSPISFTINDKQPLAVVEDLSARSILSCPEENGSVTYTITGGTPPYFYRVLDLGPVIPDPTFVPDEVIIPEIEVWGNPTRQVIPSGSPVEFRFTVDTEEDGTLLRNNRRYQVVVVDSGNERFDMAAAAASPPSFISDLDSFGDTVLRVCDELVNLPVFEVPDLTGFTVDEVFNCDLADYTVTVTLPEGNTLVTENITFVLENTDDGVISLGERGNNVFNNVPGGNYNVTLRYLNPVTLRTPPCNSADFVIRDASGTIIEEPGIVRFTLDERTPLGILRQLDEAGNRTGAPFELIGLNEYRVTAQGGRPEYQYTVTDAIGNSVPVTQDLRGRGVFTIENSGDFTVIVTDSNGCTTAIEDTRLNFIDLEIPNVFNPSSDNTQVRRWYPTNTIFGDIENFPTEGIITENGEVTFTITVGGTTSGGVQNGSIVTGGTTTGATTLITTIRPDGTSTVRQITGGTITGGTTSGGTVTVNPGGTPPIVVTGGITVGGTVTGGTSSGEIDTGIITSTGGTTVLTTTVGSFTPTAGGTISGGITLETTTIDQGNGEFITSVRIVDNAETTGGRIEGGLVTGGTVIPGSGTVVETSLSVPTMSEGAQRINPEDEFVDFSNIEVSVFDRYGRLLQEFRGILNPEAGEGWDGTYQGNDMPSGDYWYLVKLNDRRGREFTGHFTLYRSKQ